MNVILYTTGCPKCNVLHKKLEDSGIEFGVSTDVDLMLSKGFQSAPILEVDGEALTFKEAIDWINNR